jgi:hypothetical protein
MVLFLKDWKAVAAWYSEKNMGLEPVTLGKLFSFFELQFLVCKLRETPFQ